MPLNKVKPNPKLMYNFITHTWNAIKGECPHNCSYCYMKRWGKQPDLRFDAKELKTDLGSNNYIFVGSSCDMFAEAIPEDWIIKTLGHCGNFDNTYLFQTKNPKNIRRILPEKSIVCVTVESNRDYPSVSITPKPCDRLNELSKVRRIYGKMITIEPIMQFDLKPFVKMIKKCDPIQVNIGADSGKNKLPEPTKKEVESLIPELQKFTKVHLKPTLNRIIK